MELRHFDTPLLRFRIIDSTYAAELEITWINEEKRNMLPLDLEVSGDGLYRWLKRRVIPKNRSMIQKSLDYIEENLCAEITAAELADMAHLSLFHYYRLFQQATGLPVMQYILRRRLLHGVYAMKQGSTTTDAALEFGFDTYAGFYRAFCREFGSTPSEFVKSCRAKRPYRIDLTKEEHMTVTHKKSLRSCDQDQWGFIDFDLAERNARIYDPCYAATAVLSERFGKDNEAWLETYRDILWGYDSVAHLTDEERRAVPYVILANQFVCVAWFAGQDKYAELLETNKQMTLWLLDRFEQLKNI